MCFLVLQLGLRDCFFLGREIVVVGSDSLCVELGHCFSIFGLGVVEGISGFFFFLCFGLLLQGWPYQHAVGILRLARGGGSRCGNLF